MKKNNNKIPSYNAGTQKIIETANNQVRGILRSIEDAKKTTQEFEQELQILEEHKAAIQRAIDQLKHARKEYLDVIFSLSKTDVHMT